MKTFKEFYYLNETIDVHTLKQIETYADRLFNKIGIDVELPAYGHFMDRLNDKRNQKDIKPIELIQLFKKLFKKHKKRISNMGNGIQAVIKDLNTDINVPFLLKFDRMNNELDMIPKTILRKKNFKTPNQVLKI